MDDSEQYSAPFTPYSNSLNSTYSVFDLEAMKRGIDTMSGPDSKKARFNPSGSLPNIPSSAGGSGFNGGRGYDNYGYGNLPGGSALYSTPNNNMGNPNGSLSLGTTNLNLNVANLGGGMQQHSPSSPFATNPLAVSSANGGNLNGSAANYVNGMNMNGMMNAFGYNGMPGMMGLGNMGMNGMGMAGMNMGNMGMQMGFSGMGSGYGMSPQVASFQQANNRNLGMLNTQFNNTAVTAATMAAAGAANNATGRTVYVGNLPADASVDELLNLVHFGPLEAVRVLPEKSCVFISFLDGATAAAFHADANVKKLALHGQELKIGWGKASPVPAAVLLSMAQSNASRNVYLGGLDETMTEEQLRDGLSRFGLIDQVKIVRDKNIGFVHFLSISVATKVVATLPTEPQWAGKRVNYGKDRCAYVPKAQQQQGQLSAINTNFPSMPFTPMGAGFSAQSFDSPTSPAFAIAAAAAAGQQMNRTVYLGNIHPETTTEDICNSVRGGVLQSIRYMQDKHIAFITFIDAGSAFTFYQVATYQGLTLNNRRLKIGWGKNSGPLSPPLALAVHGGATRNVYVGNIEDFDLFSEERLKRDFAEYGEIELVNFLKEKNCAFVNFTNISNAIKAIENIKNKPDYTTLRVAHGKDRCANPPRSGPQGGGNRRTTAIPAEGDADGNYPIEEDVDDAAMAEYAMEAESSPGGGTLSTPPADS